MNIAKSLAERFYLLISLWRNKTVKVPVNATGEIAKGFGVADKIYVCH